MADNYLEKRMEEYRAGKLAPKSSRTVAAVARHRPGDVVLAFPQMSALVLCEDAALVDLVAKSFRKAGFQLAFCMSDSREGTRIAQSAGCRFYPYAASDAEKVGRAVDDLVSRWGRVDVVLDLRDVECGGFGEVVGNVVSLLLFHSHPDFSLVASTEVNV